MPETKTIDPRLVAQIVRRYVAHNTVAAGDLPNVIAIIHHSFTGLGKPAEASGPLTPAVAINRSHGRDFVICLECGWRGLMLRRHLTAAHALSPREYRSKWKLRDTHPLTAPAYSQRRSALAKHHGLGSSRATPPAPITTRSTPAETGLDPAFAASLSASTTLRRRGRPRKAVSASTTA